VVSFVTQNFLPARIHVRENKAEWERFSQRYGVQWTPAVLVVDPAGTERHRIEGFLPAEDFLSQLALGLGQSAFARQQFAEAEKWFRDVVKQHGGTEAAPEALYWAGVAKYKASNDAKALGETAAAFGKQYQQSSWAKKASVWGK
jgi:Thioredoxin-like domain